MNIAVPINMEWAERRHHRLKCVLNNISNTDFGLNQMIPAKCLGPYNLNHFRFSVFVLNRFSERCLVEVIEPPLLNQNKYC